jgi:type I restriction enzyme R subunit
LTASTPEQLAREQIDAQLIVSGWVVQDYNEFNPGAGRGVALREVPLKSGTCDYLLLVDRKRRRSGRGEEGRRSAFRGG